MSRVRGGTNSVTIRVSSEPVGACRKRVDLFLPLDRAALERYRDRPDEDTTILLDGEIWDEESSLPGEIIRADQTAMALDIGSRVYANTVSAGLVSAFLGLNAENFTSIIEEIFAGKPEKVVSDNLRAFECGRKRGGHLMFSHDREFSLSAPSGPTRGIFLSGTEAVGLGALSGGVDFCTSYPMSPSTGVLAFLAEQAEKFDLVVEQATDEIGAANMSVGASYAGARTIITTSGGGFSLMEEAVSLAAMTETPLTIHIAQRPGPATGLPTRTAQEDLNLVRCAGGGEFARAIYAPGDGAEAFALTAKALETADRFQIPTFVLTDQFLVDSLRTEKPADFPFRPSRREIVKTGVDYRRYDLSSPDGLSPRGVPGHGQGLVCADSDEHDESGHITEDLNLRKSMVEKRLARLSALAAEAIAPTRFGPARAKKVLIVWGSNKHLAREAREEAGADDLAVYHFSQVYPLSPKWKRFFKNRKVFVLENNATGQFADLLRTERLVENPEKILKYDGLPFFLEEAVSIIKKL